MRENENSSPLALYRVLGELSADMKHVLKALELNRESTSALSEEVKQDYNKLDTRLTKVERFNTRVLTYATVAVMFGLPVVTAVTKWGVPALITVLLGD